MELVAFLARLRPHFLGLAVAVCASAGDVIPPVETIITRMSEARAENRAKLRHYKLTREYKLFGKDKENPKSQVIAELRRMSESDQRTTSK